MMLAAVVGVPLVAGAGIWALAPTRRDRGRAVTAVAAVAALVATLASTVAAAATGASTVWPWGAGIELLVAMPAIAAPVAVTVPVVALATVVYAAMHEPREGLGRQVGLLVAFTGAMELVIVAGDLLTVLIGWELVAAISWALIGHDWRDPSRPGRAAHAFNVTRAGGLGLFLAAGAAFAGTGSLAYADLAGLDGAAMHVVAAGVVIAAMAKSGQLPFSPWLFSAMAGPTPVSALLHSATMVAAGAYLLIRLQPVLEPTGWFGPAVLGIGLATAVVGGAVAFVQSRAKHLLAASTSAQYGLMLVAVGAGYPVIAIAHLVAHAAFKSLLFLTAGVAISAVGSENMPDMRLGSHRRVTAILAAVGGLALAAVPPLGAAWSKEHIIAAATHTHLAAGVATVVAGGLSALYIARFQLLAFGPMAGDQPSGRALRDRPGLAELASIGWLAAATLALSVLWLPAAEQALGQLGRLPSGAAWELAASWGTIAVAIYLVLVGDRAGWLERLGTTGRVGWAADWAGLPQLNRRAVVDPFRSLAATAGRFDDRVVDGGVRLAAHLAATAATVAGRFDDRVLDGVVRAVAGSALAGGDLSRRADVRVVDAGVRAVAAATQLIADRWTRLTELGIDGLVRAVAGGFAWSGRDVRRVQTGAAHHYLTIVTVGTAVAVFVTALWS